MAMLEDDRPRRWSEPVSDVAIDPEALAGELLEFHLIVEMNKLRLAVDLRIPITDAGACRPSGRQIVPERRL